MSFYADENYIAEHCCAGFSVPSRVAKQIAEREERLKRKEQHEESDEDTVGGR